MGYQRTLGQPGNATFASRLNQRSFPKLPTLPNVVTGLATLGAAVTGSPSSSITSAQAISALTSGAVNGKFTYLGADMTVNNTFYVAPSVRSGVGWHYVVEFDYYGASATPAFEFGYRGQGALATQVEIDGQLAEAPYTSDSTQDGTNHLRKVTFSAPGWHRIRLHLSAAFSQVNIGPNDIVIPTPAPKRKLLWIGDSYGDGTGATGPTTGMAFTAGRLLDFSSVYGYSIGGTGLLAVGSSVKYRDRAADWAAVDPAAVVLQMSINDDASSTSALVTEMGLTVAAIQAQCPNARDIWIMGTPARGGSDVATKQGREPALAAAAASLGLLYVNLVSPTPLWTGTGGAESPSGTGSTDVFYHNQGGLISHPTQAGHDAMARYFASAVIASRSAA
jgi:hypothetical protein